jgi:putative selenium metabolism protein SsnA
MLIVHGTLLLRQGGYRLLPDGALRLDGARIAEIGPSQDLEAKYPQEERLDAQGMLVMPGLVCAHTHFYRLLGRGLDRRGFEPRNLEQALRGIWWKLDAALDYESIRYATLMGCIEAVRHGVTTVFDHLAAPNAVRYALDAAAEAVLQVGLRACLAYEVSDRHGLPGGRAGVEENVRFARRVRQETLLAASMGLQSSFTLSDQTLAAAVGGAAITDIGMHVHVAHDRFDQLDCFNRYGLRVVERLRRVGVLGPRTLAVHCVHVTLEEMEILAKNRCWVVHNPRANMHYAVGLAPVVELLQHGLPVGLGGDGFGHDLFWEMRLAHLLQRYSTGDPRALPAQTVAEMLLGHNAALASRIFRDKLGELSVGALADLIVVEEVGPTPVTAANLAERLVGDFTGCQVDTVIVAGKVLMRHRRLLTVDEPAVMARARELTRQVWARL